MNLPLVTCCLVLAALGLLPAVRGDGYGHGHGYGHSSHGTVWIIDISRYLDNSINSFCVQVSALRA